MHSISATQYMMMSLFPESTSTSYKDQIEIELNLLQDTGDLEENITHRRKLPSIPSMTGTSDYTAFQHLRIADKEHGSASADFEWPGAVAVQGGTGHIYVTDMGLNCGKIRKFSERGDNIAQFDTPRLSTFWGIAIHQDKVFVSVSMSHCIILFQLPELIPKRQVGLYGFGKEDFNYPRQLALSPDQLLYVADELNDRIQILNCDLVFQSSIQHQTMVNPVDVKFSANLMFVLSRSGDLCIHTFTLSGEKISSIITMGNDDHMQVRGAFFFCLDARNNSIIISDYSAHNLKVFSPEGELLRIIGKEGHEPGMFYHPHGITILRDGRLVSVSQKHINALQIFLP